MPEFPSIPNSGSNYPAQDTAEPPSNRRQGFAATRQQMGSRAVGQTRSESPGPDRPTGRSNDGAAAPANPFTESATRQAEQMPRPRRGLILLQSNTHLDNSQSIRNRPGAFNVISPSALATQIAAGSTDPTIQRLGERLEVQQEALLSQSDGAGNGTQETDDIEEAIRRSLLPPEQQLTDVTDGMLQMAIDESNAFAVSDADQRSQREQDAEAQFAADLHAAQLLSIAETSDDDDASVPPPPELARRSFPPGGY